MPGSMSKRSVSGENPITRALQRSKDPRGAFDFTKFFSRQIHGLEVSRTVSRDLEAMSRRFLSVLNEHVKHNINPHICRFDLRHELELALAVRFFLKAAETASTYISYKRGLASKGESAGNADPTATPRPDKKEMEELKIALSLTRESRASPMNSSSMAEHILRSKSFDKFTDFLRMDPKRFNDCAYLAAIASGRQDSDYNVLREPLA